MLRTMKQRNPISQQYCPCESSYIAVEIQKHFSTVSSQASEKEHARFKPAFKNELVS